MLGLTLIASLSEGSLLKGLLGGALGMILGTIGVAPIGGETRFTFGIPVLQHAEDKELSCGGVMNEGKVATALGLRGAPNAAESGMVARDCYIAELTGGHLHVCHVSTREAVEQVRGSRVEHVHRIGAYGGTFMSGAEYAQAKGYFPVPRTYTEIVLRPHAEQVRDRIKVISSM